MFNIPQVQYAPEMANVFKILLTGVLSFLLAFVITPLWTHILYRYKIGIKIKKTDVRGEKLTFINKLHAAKEGTPTMGGVIVWMSVLILILASQYIFPFVAEWTGANFIANLDFLRRRETWLPLFALVTAGVLGLLDDYYSVRKIGSNKGGGCDLPFAFGGFF
jgi:UDP-N-acetylmuramyl pentapeptide phosphotransferase/UDP-N-acetylglucosamine-1-phosphate transferase